MKMTTLRKTFYVDKRALYWKKMPSRTFIAREEKSRPGFKASKGRLTLLLGLMQLATLSGRHCSFTIPKTSRVFKNYAKCSVTGTAMPG